MRWFSFALAALLLSIGPATRAGDPDRPRRFAVSLRAGGFDEQGSAGMHRKDGAPGNPVLGWKGSGQVAAAFSFDVRPCLTLDLSYVELEYDIGSDLVPGPDGEIVSTRIATGTLDEYRLAVILDGKLFAAEPTYYISPQRKSKGRVALAILGAVTEVGDIEVDDSGRQLLGIDDIATERQTSAGLGVRMDYRFKRSGFTVGADLGWMWSLNGDLFTVNTTPDSPYSGTTLEHQGLNFLLDLSYHF